MTRLAARLFLVVAASSIISTASPAIVRAEPANASIAGVWEAREAMPGGVETSEVQTLFLTPEGKYRREIVVEASGASQPAGKVIDAGTYTFTAPHTFGYRRTSWSVCQMGACRRGRPKGDNAGTLPFLLHGPRHATFIGLGWTRTG